MMLDKSSAVASILLDIIKEKVRTRADLMVGLFVFVDFNETLKIYVSERVYLEELHDSSFFFRIGNQR